MYATFKLLLKMKNYLLALHFMLIMHGLFEILYRDTTVFMC